jgi:hypothetical protein
MVPRGVRNYIVGHISNLSGSIRRVHNTTIGQHLVLSVTGTPEAISTLESNLLIATEDHWSWESRGVDQEVTSMSHHFSIIQSGDGAICGADNKYDNKSEESIKSISSKNSGSSKNKMCSL